MAFSLYLFRPAGPAAPPWSNAAHPLVPSYTLRPRICLPAAAIRKATSNSKRAHAAEGRRSRRQRSRPCVGWRTAPPLLAGAGQGGGVCCLVGGAIWHFLASAGRAARRVEPA